MGAWTNEEIATYLRRVAGLVKYGFEEDEAENLAARLLERDSPDSGDDRRICLECVNFRKGVCAKRIGMVRTLLQRCEAFKLRN